MSESLTSKLLAISMQLRNHAQGVYNFNAFRAGAIDDLADEIDQVARSAVPPTDALDPHHAIRTYAERVRKALTNEKYLRVQQQEMIELLCELEDCLPEWAIETSVTKFALPTPEQVQDAITAAYVASHPDETNAVHDYGAGDRMDELSTPAAQRKGI